MAFLIANYLPSCHPSLSGGLYQRPEKRNRHHEKLLSEYVKEHGLSATMYQDNGQAAIPLK